MKFIDLVKERYSCKSFSDKAISDDIINNILEAGRFAPTAKNNQPQKIFVLKSADALAKVDKNTPCRYNAPVVLAVGFDRDNQYIYPKEKYKSGVEDATIVSTHMLLAAKDNGVDSCWLNYVDMDGLKSDLGLDENVELVMLLDLGYPKDEFKPLENHFNRKELSETVKWL